MRDKITEGGCFFHRNAEMEMLSLRTFFFKEKHIGDQVIQAIFQPFGFFRMFMRCKMLLYLFLCLVSILRDRIPLYHLVPGIRSEPRRLIHTQKFH